MKHLLIVIANFGFFENCNSQPLDTSKYSIQVAQSAETNMFFARDKVWRGADCASSIDLANGKVLWLFGDGFICKDSSGSRKNATMIRNSVAIQDGYDLKNASLKYYYDVTQKKPKALFRAKGKLWFWPGNGIMVRDRLLIFLIKERGVKNGLGFEAVGWNIVLISNPYDEPTHWKMKYIEGPETFGTIAGSAAVLKDENYLYAYGAVEPASHEVYVLRWNLTEVYNGNMSNPEWWMDGKWSVRISKDPVPAPLFIGGTEYSVHYDSSLKKYIQIQSHGFGAGSIGIRMADSLQGKWSEPYMFHKPAYPGVNKPFMYAAKAHPELKADGIYITFNVNSFDFGELVENQAIYFPRFLLLTISQRK